MKKILMIANLSSIHTIKWINYFGEEFNISVVSSSKLLDKSTLNKNIKSHIIEKFSNKFFNSIYIIYLILFKNLVSKDQDLIHVHYLGWNALIGFFLKIKFFKSNYVSTIWGNEIKINKNNIFKYFILQIFFKISNIITTDSHEIKNELLSKYKININKIKIINFGIDTNFFKKKIYNSQIASKFGLIKDEINIISLRNHSYIYDIETLIKSISIISKKIKVKCFIFGFGPLTEKYKKNVRDLCLNDYIKFPGKYFQKDLPDIFSVFDIYVSSSLTDGGIAASTAEAMSCETPVIITNNSDNKKWVDHKYNGFIFENSDYKSLANMILNIKSFNSKIIGKRAREKILKDNDYFNEMRKMKIIYNDIC